MKTLTLCITLFFIFVLSTQSCNAQAFYKEGLIVNNDGDTVRGWIDYRQWEKNPDEIRFRTSETSTHTSYTVAELKYFEVKGLDRYTRATISKDMRPVELSQLEKNNKDITATETVFLRELVLGGLSLYQFVDFKPHFYVRKGDAPLEELTYKVYLTSDQTRISYVHLFREQLRQWIDASKSNSQIEGLLERANYTEKDLVRVVQMINQLQEDPIAYIIQRPRSTTSFFVGAGMVYSTISISGYQESLDKLNFSGGFSPSLTAGVDIGILRNLQKLKLRFELGWYTSTYEGNTQPGAVDSVNFQLKMSTIATSVSLLYNLVNQENNKLYLGAGFYYNFSSYSKNRIVKRYGNSPDIKTLTPYEMQKSWISFHARAGYIFKKKFELAASMKLGGAFTNYSSFSIGPTIVSAGFNYHF